MIATKNIVVVCEGESEWAYLQRLNSMLAGLPYPADMTDVPIRFIGRPKRHLSQMPDMDLGGLNELRIFAESMLGEISRWYELPR